MNRRTQQQTLQHFGFNTQYQISKAYFTLQKTKQNSLDQLYLIQQQNDLLKIVKQQLEKKSLSSNRFLSEKDSNNQTQNEMTKNQVIFSNKNWNKSLCSTPTNKSVMSFQSFRHKRNDITSKKTIQQALEQINQKCSEITSQCIQQVVKQMKVQKQKIKDLKTFQLNNQKLKRDYIIFKNRYQQQLILIKKLENKIILLQQQKSKNLKQWNQKQRNLTIQQTNLLVKQMLFNQNVKKLNHKLQNLKNKQNVIQNDLETVQNLWEKILDHIQKGKEQFEDSFKNTIYIKCKQSLKNQRKVIADQLEELDQQHAFIQKMLTKLKGT